MKRKSLVFALLAVPVSIAAQPAPQTTPSKAQAQFAGTTETWTTEDKPYKAAREAIVKARDAGKNMLALAKEYGAAAGKQQDEDALAVFRWGYAAALAYEYGKYPSAANEIFSAEQALAKAPSPHSYQYDRLRFLIGAGIHYDHGMERLGERLIKRAPNDFYVVYFEVELLAGNLSKSDDYRAMELSKMLIEKYPDSSGSYERAGLVYQHLWWGYAKKSDAQTAIGYYRKGIAFIPANNPQIVASYEAQISHLEHEMKTDKRAH